MFKVLLYRCVGWTIGLDLLSRILKTENLRILTVMKEGVQVFAIGQKRGNCNVLLYHAQKKIRDPKTHFRNKKHD